jgi:hypothetical protein
MRSRPWVDHVRVRSRRRLTRRNVEVLADKQNLTRKIINVSQKKTQRLKKKHGA